MAKLAASEAATAISHQVSVPGAWSLCPGEAPGLRSVSHPSPSPPFYVADPPPVFPWGWGLFSLLSPCFSP